MRLVQNLRYCTRCRATGTTGTRPSNLEAIADLCGIAGIVALRNGPSPRAQDVRAMLETLRHRGPDSEGLLVETGAALGCRRLAVIDLQGGDQPSCNEDGSVAVFQNGEIYNFQELRTELEAKHHVFRTKSDTEVIAHLYEEHGDSFVERLRGMFAVAVFDRRRQRLILVRDRLGKKPLYYAELPDRFVFASELKALLTMPEFPRAIDHEALLDFFTYRGVPAPKTIFRAARKLLPGHLLIIDDSGVQRPRSYWTLSFAEPFEDSPERLVERLRGLIEECVRLRLAADVPLGALLSGGVDSAAVVATLVRQSATPVRTYSVGTDDPLHDERADARATAQQLGTLHTEALVAPDVEAALEVLPWHFDEPFSDASALPTFAVSKLARQQVTVVLSGDGGDENFAGYDHHLYDARAGRLRKLIPLAARPLVRALSAAYPDRIVGSRRVPGRNMLRYLADDPLRAYFSLVRVSDPAFVRHQLGGELRARLRGYDPFDVLAAAHARTDAPDDLGRILQTDISTYLANDILTKVDRASMAASLEVRCPLLDHRLVEFAARLPSALKLHRGQGKWIFRRALEGLVPEQALRRPKHGFSIPLRAWTKDEFRPAIEAAIHEAPAELYDQRSLLDSWRAHLSGASDHSEFFWALLALDSWRRRHGIEVP